MTDESGRGWAVATAAVLALAGLNIARQLPEVHSLGAVVFGDPGMGLSADALITDGRIPTRDFAYYYGLLGLAAGRGWYALFGRTAAADTALLLAGALAVAWGMVRFGRAVGLPPAARWVLVCGVPVAVMPLRYPSPTHALDAVLLAHALAWQARGNLRAAFAAAVAGVFVKSALASVYATGLLAVILFTSRQGRFRELLPGALLGCGIAAGLVGWFGVEPVVKTLLPLDGGRTYGGERYGFLFGVGRRFWLPESPSLVYYLFGPAGFWLAASAVGLAGAPGLVRDRRDPRAAALLACVALHLVFVLLLFGHDLSWLYYSFLPVLAAAGVVGRWGGPRWLLAGMPALAACGCVGFAVYGGQLWNDRVRTEATGGLFASPADAAAWERVRELARRERVLVLTPSGAGRVLFPELDSVRSWALLAAVAPVAEVDDLLNRLRAADAVVVPNATAVVFGRWSPFAAELAHFAEVPGAGGDSFRVMRRADSAGLPPADRRN